MKLIDTTSAVGHVLCHDITKIIPGEEKGPVFRKGHIVREEDIPILLSVGKEHLYVWEKDDDMLHEDEAASVLKDICMLDDPNMSASEPKEGKIEIRAAVPGVLKIDREKHIGINSLGEMMIATVHGDFPVRKGDKIAGTRVIPLVISKEKMNEAKAISCDGQILKILPFRQMTYGLITTGSEVNKGLIKDGFGPVVMSKMDEYGATLKEHVILSDDRKIIADTIREFASRGCDIVIVTGGMSVDPDDRTPGAVKDTGAEIVSYGAPVLPGAMFLMSYLKLEDGKEVPVMGLPGCVMYAKRTIFDLILPRVIAGDRISSEDLARLGEGGLCKSCEICRFPDCGFGR